MTTLNEHWSRMLRLLADVRDWGQPSPLIVGDRLVLWDMESMGLIEPDPAKPGRYRLTGYGGDVLKTRQITLEA